MSTFVFKKIFVFENKSIHTHKVTRLDPFVKKQQIGKTPIDTGQNYMI